VAPQRCSAASSRTRTAKSPVSWGASKPNRSRYGPVSLQGRLPAVFEERQPDRLRGRDHHRPGDAGHGATALSALVDVVADEHHQINGHVVIDVADDGIGGADPAAGTGLAGLADRVAALGGRLDVESPPGGGTVTRAELPARRSERTT
jgi:hypothetical protein